MRESARRKGDTKGVEEEEYVRENIGNKISKIRKKRRWEGE